MSMSLTWGFVRKLNHTESAPISGRWLTNNADVSVESSFLLWWFQQTRIPASLPSQGSEDQMDCQKEAWLGLKIWQLEQLRKQLEQDVQFCCHCSHCKAFQLF